MSKVLKTFHPGGIRTHALIKILRDGRLVLDKIYLMNFVHQVVEIKSRPTNFRRVTVKTRVARWYIFRPKIIICVNFGRVLNRKTLIYFIAIRILAINIFYGHLVI
jgi:hypothetical protein